MTMGVVYGSANSRRCQNGQFDVVAVPEIVGSSRIVNANFESIEEFTNNLVLEFFFALNRDAVDAVTDLSSWLQDQTHPTVFSGTTRVHLSR
jgi:hypothetical protein